MSIVTTIEVVNQTLVESQVFTVTTISTGFSVISGGGGGGVSDHGELSGLSDDDHPHYHNNTRGDARYYTQTQADSFLSEKQPLNANLTSVAGLSALATGNVRLTNGVASLDNNSYYLASNPNGYTSNTGTVTTFSFTNGGGFTGTVGTAGTTPTLSLALQNATSLQNGQLTSADWNTFNGKQDALVSGTNIKTVNGNSLLGSGDLVISGGTANLSLGTITTTAIPVNIDTGTDVTLPSATTLLAGLQSAADKTKLDGIAAGATANSSDAILLARANHTGTQASSTISDFTEASQDATGAMVDSTLVYVDATPSLGRAAITGDVTIAAGSNAATIANDAVTFAKMQNVATATLLGRSTAGTGDVETITIGANLTLSAGVLSASGGGGGGSPAGTTGQIQYNNAGSFGGAANVQILNNELAFNEIATPATPTDNNVKLFGQDTAGETTLNYMWSDSKVRTIQQDISQYHHIYWNAIPNGNTLTSIGLATMTNSGTATAASIATTNKYTRTPRLDMLVTTAATTAVAGYRAPVALVTIGGSAAGVGGFECKIVGAPATGVATTTSRYFMGMTAGTTAPTDVEPSTVQNIFGVGYDAADTNLQLMHRAAGAVTKVDLGASFPVPTTDRSVIYQLEIHAAAGTTQSIGYKLTEIISGVTTTGIVTTNIPATTTLLAPRIWSSVGGTSSVIGITFVTTHLWLPNYL